MTVLILGGTGTLGSAIARCYIRDGQKPICFDNNPNSERFKDFGDKVTILRGDITHIDDIVDAIVAHKVDRLINMAYLFGNEASLAPKDQLRINVTGMNNSFEAARLTGIHRVMYASSIAVNGPQTSYGDKFVTEDDLCYPNSFYGWAKQFNEIVAEEYSQKYGMSIIGVRPSYSLTTTPRILGFSSTSHLVAFPAMGYPVLVEESPDRGVHIGHEDYVGEVFFRLCEASKVEYPVYFAGGHGTTFGQLAQIVKEFIPDASIELVPNETTRYEIAPVNIDDTKMREEIGFVNPPLAQWVSDVIDIVRTRNNKR